MYVIFDRCINTPMVDMLIKPGYIYIYMTDVLVERFNKARF